MIITITLNTAEIACLSLNDQYEALASILRNEATYIESEGPCEGSLEDVNGNELGQLEVYE